MSLFYSHPWLIIWISCRSFSLCFLRESFHCLLTPALPLNYLIPFEFPFLCIWPIFPSRIFPLSLAVWKFTVVCLRMFLFSLIVLDTQGFFWLYLYFFPFIISLLISSLPFSLRLWCWERLKAGGEGDDRGWDGWMASPTFCWSPQGKGHALASSK